MERNGEGDDKTLTLSHPVVLPASMARLLSSVDCKCAHDRAASIAAGNHIARVLFEAHSQRMRAPAGNTLARRRSNVRICHKCSH